jgi:hypothetical protein
VRPSRESEVQTTGRQALHGQRKTGEVERLEIDGLAANQLPEAVSDDDMLDANGRRASLP